MDFFEQHWKAPPENNITCMMIDADYFKQINDASGHEAGDKVLCQLARVLQDQIRTDDLVCRLGGDEFMVICPKTDLKGGLNLARKLLNAVNKLVVNAGSSMWMGSVSIGLASSRTALGHFDNLMSAADNQVYIAKRSGRNCIRPLSVDS